MERERERGERNGEREGRNEGQRERGTCKKRDRQKNIKKERIYMLTHVKYHTIKWV